MDNYLHCVKRLRALLRARCGPSHILERGVGKSLVNRVDFVQNRGLKRQIDRTNVFLELRQGRGPDDGTGDKPAVAHECQRHCRGTQAMAPGQFDVGSGRRLDIGLVVALPERGKPGQAGRLRLSAIQLLAAQVPER